LPQRKVKNAVLDYYKKGVVRLFSCVQIKLYIFASIGVNDIC